MRTVGILVVAVVLGVLAGAWFLAGGADAPGETASGAPSAADEAAVEARRDTSQAQGADASDGPPATRNTAEAGHDVAGRVAPAHEPARAPGGGIVPGFEEQVASKQARSLEILEAFRRAEDGEVDEALFGSPPDLPERFSMEALRAAVDDAITEKGLRGGVTFVDCTGFPCFVGGELYGGEPSERGRIEALLGARALAAYANDGRVYKSSAGTADDGESVRRFVMAFFQPESDPDRRLALDLMMRRRLQELGSAF